MPIWWIVVVIALVFNGDYLAEAFFSEGFFAISDDFYDGGIFDGTTGVQGNQFITSTSYMHTFSDQMYSVRTVRECQLICLREGCPSFVIDRNQGLCIITSFNRCNNNAMFLRMYPGYITYEIVPGGTSKNAIKRTCFDQCLESGNCDNCGRFHCSGMYCDTCLKTCWEIPPIINNTFFWPDLQTIVPAICNDEWQSAFSSGAFLTYPYMLLQHPFWLQVVITLSDASQLNAFFDSFETDGSSYITVGGYAGGSAGNAWNAPVNLPLIYNNKTVCSPFFYPKDSCSITPTQIPTIKTQRSTGTGIVNDGDFKRGFVWDICGKDHGTSVYVSNIDLRVTPKNASDPNPAFLLGLPNITCV